MPCRGPEPGDFDYHVPDKTEVNRLTRLLCKACEIIEQIDCYYFKEELENTNLGRWWSKHQKLDSARQEIENEKKRLKKVEKQALAKLSKEEKEVLGLFK